MNGLLGKSNDEHPLPNSSSDFHVAKELSEHFLLKFGDFSDIFKNTPPSKSRPNPDIQILPLTIFAEIKQEETFCILRTVNEYNYANGPLNKRKMSYEIISYLITTKCTNIVNRCFS